MERIVNYISLNDDLEIPNGNCKLIGEVILFLEKAKKLGDTHVYISSRSDGGVMYIGTAIEEVEDDESFAIREMIYLMNENQRESRTIVAEKALYEYLKLKYGS